MDWAPMAEIGHATARHSTKNRQAKLIAAMLDPAHKTQAAACDAAGVPLRTAQTWLSDDPVFQADLRAAELAMVSHAARRLLALTDSAISALADNLDEYSKPAHSLRAAALVLANSRQWRELEALDARIAALEAAQPHGEND